jgi:hypothetical protein
MGSTLYVIVVTAALAALQVPLLAQENSAPPSNAPSPAPPAPSSPPADPDNRRFVLYHIDGGFLRLDTRTGAIDSCALRGTEWNCVVGRDERASLDRLIAQLQHDNGVLKNALLEHDVALPDGMVPAAPAGGGGGEEEPIPRPPQTVPPQTVLPPAAAAPSHGEEVNRVMTAMEKGWRRLLAMMTNLQHDLQKQE